MEEFKTLEEQKHKFNLLQEELKLLEKQKNSLESQISYVNKQIEYVDVFYDDIEVVITPELFEKAKEEKYGRYREYKPKRWNKNYKKVLATYLVNPLTFKVRKDINFLENNKVFYYMDRDDNGLPDNTYVIEKNEYRQCEDLERVKDLI